VRVGVQLPEVEREVPWAEVLAIVRTTEASGFDSAWVGDHLLHREPEAGPLEAWTQLAALAAATERLTLGPLVACLAFHPPGLIAKMAATVDEISGGRLVLGVGAGWNDEEFTAFGLPPDRKVSRFEEAFTLVRRLLAGERVTHRGRYWSAEDAVLLPPTRRRIPLMTGSSGPRALSIVLPYVDSWNTWWEYYGNTAEGFAQENGRVDAACEAAGRDPVAVERSACVLVTVDGGAGARPEEPGMPRVDVDQLPGHLLALAQAGAHEAILVLDPITVETVGRAAAVLQLRDR
jgi:alkanesulfonate monooxygenase SsuD/methylene tetrahydromethanopterin reductase-like flavin-dependent oxidoreductase (luciferase family)